MGGQIQMLAMERVFATVELFEHIFSFVLASLHPVTDQENPISVKNHANAELLMRTMACSQVNRRWHGLITRSKYIQRALFLLPDPTIRRSWIKRSGTKNIASYYRAPSLMAPLLNPVIQTSFPGYNYRFCWNSSSQNSSGESKHCAFLMITRRDLSQLFSKAPISNMLLSQPPCTTLEATIYDERQLGTEYLARTTVLDDPIITCEDGLTLGMLHERVKAMFERYQDVFSIRLTTV